MTKHPRVDVADVLRGIAVMGIILLHSIEHFNFYSYPDTAGQSEWLDFSDKAIWDGMFFLFGGKAYAVFALLFGFSFFIQYDNQRLRGKDFRGRFCWRLFLLFLFGNLNASFFTAEVLVLYSLVGFILPLTCRLKDKWLLVLACVLLIQTPTLILRHPGGLRPGIRHSGRTHRAFVGTNFRRTTGRHVLGNRTREPLGGTTG